MDAPEVGQAAAPKTPEVAHVGSTWPKLTDIYLTVHDQQELSRVGCAEEPTQRVANLVREFHSEQKRLLWPAIGMLGAGVSIFALSAAGAPNWSGWVPTIFAVFCFLILARLVSKANKNWDDLVVIALMKAIRELEREQPHFGQASYFINAAADTFYRGFKRRRGDTWSAVKRKPPRKYRSLQSSDAERGASAIASQAWRLDGEKPACLEAADDLRRAVLRVASGYWRQVGDLDVAYGRSPLWSPPGVARRLRTALQQDNTIKLLGLITALIVLTAALIKLGPN